MKCKIIGKHLHFTDYTDSEIKWLDEKLTWEGYSYNEEQEDGSIKLITPVEKLLFTDSSGSPYTFAGLFESIKQEGKLAELNFELVEQPPLPEFNRIEIDKNILPADPNGYFEELASFQCEAVAKTCMLKSGIVQIPTGGGKTEIMLATLRYLMNNNLLKRALLVVPSKGLADQFQARGFLRGFSKSEIGVFHGTKKQTNSIITVAVVNSIVQGLKYKTGFVQDLLKEINYIGFEEGHHLRANSWVEVLNKASQIEYLVVYSATPFQNLNVLENPGDALIQGLAGKTIFVETNEHLRKIGFTAEPVVYMKPVPGRYLKYHGRFDKIYNKFIIENKVRNDFITGYSRRFVQLGFPVMVLVQRIDHAKELMLSMPDVNSICVFGGNKGLQIDDLGQLEETPIDYDVFRSNFEAGQWDLMIGSTVMDEGMDIPSVGAVILGGGGKSRIKTLQRIGRGGRRKRKGLNRFYVVDFYDKPHIYLTSHSKKRKQMFIDIKATVVEDPYQFINMAIAHSEAMK